LEKRHALAYLQNIQKQFSYIPRERILQLAERLAMPVSELYAIATFYKALSLTPRGRHMIHVCDGTACHIRGSVRLLDVIKRELDIEPGGTTGDMLFSLEVVNCLGACALGPVMLVDDDYHGGVTADTLPAILAGYRKDVTEGAVK
jgi:NADH-quinone oxidoreductase subunit E